MEPKITSPIFLVGSERSGTTLLRLMLDHHPDIAFNLESEYMVNKIGADNQFPNIDEYQDFLENDRVFNRSNFKIDSKLDYKALLNSFLNQKLKRDNKKIVGATVHYNFLKLLNIWPNAKFIYLYRDGRDVANSVIQMGWAGNTYVAANWWINAEVECEKLRNIVKKEQLIEIKYENLLEFPEKILIRICEYIGVPFSRQMFGYQEDTSYDYPDVKYAYQWKKKNTSKEIQLIESRIADLLYARGYELSGLPIINFNFINKKRMYISSRVLVLLHRIRKFGLILTIKEILARRFHADSIVKAIQKERNKIIDQSLK